MKTKRKKKMNQQKTLTPQKKRTTKKGQKHHKISSLRLHKVGKSLDQKRIQKQLERDSVGNSIILQQQADKISIKTKCHVCFSEDL